MVGICPDSDGLKVHASCCMQTPDPNNPVEKKEEREVVSIDGPMDAVFLSPGDYVELDVGTGDQPEGVCISVIRYSVTQLASRSLVGNQAAFRRLRAAARAAMAC